MKIQEDLLNLYNDLVELSKSTLENIQKPVKVNFEESMNSLSLEQAGTKIYTRIPFYYSGKISEIKNTYLLPEDYNYLMGTLNQVIQSGKLANDRLCISPEVYGFDIYLAEVSQLRLKEGPILLGQIRFCSGNSWLFRTLTKIKYGTF